MIRNIRRKIAYWLCPEALKIVGKQYKENEVLREMLRQEKIRNEGIDPKNIMRQLLGSMTIDMYMTDIENGMSEDERKRFHRWGFDIANNEWWKQILKYTINKQASETLKIMTIKDSQAWFGGGTLNGIMIFEEAVERLRVLHESDIIPEEDFNKDKAIQG